VHPPGQLPGQQPAGTIPPGIAGQPQGQPVTIRHGNETITVSPPDASGRVRLSVGDGSGPPSASEEPGEIRIRGPVVMRGYHGDPAATAAALRGGWLHTRDAGRLLPDGRLRVLGRRDEVIISGGVNVHPVEVEQVLSRHPLVGDVAVAGATDPEWGQRVVAFVVPDEPGRPPSLEELRGFARERLAAAKLPRQLVLVDEVPRSPGGKLQRRRLGLAPSGEGGVGTPRG